MRRSVLVVLLAGVSMPSAPALAATVRVDYQRDAVVYRAAPGEWNRLSVTASRGSTSQGDQYVRFTVEDSVAINPGVGCRRVDPGRRGFVECELFGSARALVHLGNRSDRGRVLNFFDYVVLDGGRGDDLLVGGPSRDTLLGGPGTDDLRGGAGVDLLLAGGHGLSTDPTADRLRGGRDSDLLMGSAGPNLIEPGPGVDQVSAGGGRDIVLARDDAIEQVHCGAGGDSAVTDGVDYPLACEHHEPYSNSSPVPLEFSAAEQRASLLLGCREGHPAACSGTVQLELDGRAISEQLPFTGANRHRWVMMVDTTDPVPGGASERPDLVVRIRAENSSGAATDDRYPVPTLLVGSPFLRP
jgi:RTX calcium-binding nonapeptide repeat (4 copies)